MWNPAWAWAILAAIIIAFVAVFDVHASIVHTETMSGRFRDWLFNPAVGPFAFGIWVGVFVGLTFHWFEYKRR